MKSILLLVCLVAGHLLSAQCPIGNCEKNFKLTFPFDATESNAVNGDKCFINNTGYGMPLTNAIFKEWLHLTIYSYPLSAIYLVDPFSIGPKQNLYIIGTSLIQELSMENGGTIYLNGDLNINHTSKVKGANYIFISEGSALRLIEPSYTILYVGDTIRISEDDFIVIAQCGTSATNKYDNNISRELIFDITGKVVKSPEPYRMYIKGKKKFIIIK